MKQEYFLAFFSLHDDFSILLWIVSKGRKFVSIYRVQTRIKMLVLSGVIDMQVNWNRAVSRVNIILISLFICLIPIVQWTKGFEFHILNQLLMRSKLEYGCLFFRAISKCGDTFSKICICRHLCQVKLLLQTTLEHGLHGYWLSYFH